MTEVIDVKPIMDKIRFRARVRALKEHKKNFQIKISPGMKRALSKVKKTCGRC